MLPKFHETTRHVPYERLKLSNKAQGWVAIEMPEHFSAQCFLTISTAPNSHWMVHRLNSPNGKKYWIFFASKEGKQLFGLCKQLLKPLAGVYKWNNCLPTITPIVFDTEIELNASTTYGIYKDGLAYGRYRLEISGGIGMHLRLLDKRCESPCRFALGVFLTRA